MTKETTDPILRIHRNYHFNLYARIVIGKMNHEFRLSGKVKTRNKAGKEIGLADAQHKFLSKRTIITLGSKKHSSKKLTDRAHYIQLDVYKR